MLTYINFKKPIGAITEGFNWNDEELIKDAEECDDYYALDASENVIIQEAVKDMDIRSVLTAMSGVVPPPGWKAARGANSALLTLDNKWMKWSEDMKNKLVAAGWKAIAYPEHYRGSAWRIFCEVCDANRKGIPYAQMSQGARDWYDLYQQAIMQIPPEAFEYIPIHANTRDLRYWRCVCISPDEGLVFVQKIHDWGRSTSQHIIAATGRKYYILKGAKYDVKAERTMEKELRKATSQLYRYFNNMSYIMNRLSGMAAFDIDGSPVIRFILNEDEEWQALPKYIRQAGKYFGQTDCELRNKCCKHSMRQVNLSNSGDELRPALLMADDMIYYAVYLESKCPAVFEKCRQTAALKDIQFMTKTGSKCTMICEFGFTGKGFQLYRQRMGK